MPQKKEKLLEEAVDANDFIISDLAIQANNNQRLLNKILKFPLKAIEQYKITAITPTQFVNSLKANLEKIQQIQTFTQQSNKCSQQSLKKVAKVYYKSIQNYNYSPAYNSGGYLSSFYGNHNPYFRYNNRLLGATIRPYGYPSYYNFNKMAGTLGYSYGCT